MPGKRKKFIEKKNAVTYKLVPRFQLDPDGDTSEHVLVPVNETEHKKSLIKLPDCVVPPSEKQIPSLEKVLQAKGPVLDWDPENVSALDEDSDCEDSVTDFDDDFFAKAGPLVPDPVNNLDDDFIAKSGPVVSDSIIDFDEDFISKAGPVVRNPKPSDESGSESEDCDSSDLFSDADEDSYFGNDGDDDKIKLTQYSLTSAAENCTEEFKTFNERFEKFCETYTDDQIGGLDFEEVEGYLTPDSEIVKELVKDFQKFNTKRCFEDHNAGSDLKSKILHYAQQKHKEKLVEITFDEPPEFDCESILSTRSNLYNHPTLIKAEKKEKKVKQAKVKKVPADDNFECETLIVQAVATRQKNETSEEKRQRKQAMKEMKRASRKFKKENTAFEKEKEKKRIAKKLNEAQNRGVRLL